MPAQIQPVRFVRLNILVIGITCNGKAVLGPIPSPRRRKGVHLALHLPHAMVSFAVFVDGSVGFGTDISDAKTIVLKDQAHALQQGMHFYGTQGTGQSSTLPFELQVPQIVALAFVSTRCVCDDRALGARDGRALTVD